MEIIIDSAYQMDTCANEIPWVRTPLLNILDAADKLAHQNRARDNSLLQRISGW